MMAYVRPVAEGGGGVDPVAAVALGLGLAALVVALVVLACVLITRREAR